MSWPIIIVILFTGYTWYNIIRWVPQILTSPIVCLALGGGLLLIIIGVVIALTSNKHKE